MKEVDSLGIGQFSNMQQNAALCIAIISKVHNGAVAVGRCERLLCNGSSSTLFRTKKESIGISMLSFFGGKRWIRLIAERASLLA